MTNERQAFDEVGERFLNYYREVRGHVREVVTRENLQPYVPSPPGTAIDIGGGDGRDAAWLAGLGLEVTLVDPSVEMLGKARQRFSDTDVEVTVLEGSSTDLPSEVIDKKYDLVLSHGVLMYQADPQEHIEVLAELADPHKGFISILTKGHTGALQRARAVGDTKSESTLRKSGMHLVSNGLEEKTWALRPTEVISMIQKAGLRLQDWYGVRIESDLDHRLISQVPADELQHILETEKRLSREPGPKGRGQMLHYIARVDQAVRAG